MYFTWDRPSGKKAIKWNLPGVAKVSNCKPIDVNKVSKYCTVYTMHVQCDTIPKVYETQSVWKAL